MTPYRRQERLPGWGVDAQKKVEASHVLVVGMGGLGCPAAVYLARAGVGELTICDFDKVQPHDLHRQILYGDEDVGWPKVQVAETRLEEQHPQLKVHPKQKPFDSGMVTGVDIVLDCTDEPGTRALIHQACIDARKPLAWAAVEGWEAQWMVVKPGETPCMRCVWPSPSDAPSCEDAGIAGPVVGMAGTWQALAALRLMIGQEPGGRLHLADLRADEHKVIDFPRRPDCPTCSAAAK